MLVKTIDNVIDDKLLFISKLSFQKLADLCQIYRVSYEWCGGKTITNQMDLNDIIQNIFNKSESNIVFYEITPCNYYTYHIFIIKKNFNELFYSAINKYLKIKNFW